MAEKQLSKDELGRMSFTELLIERDEALGEVCDAAGVLWGDDTSDRSAINPVWVETYETAQARVYAATAELERRTEQAKPIPEGHVRLPDGRDVKHPMWKTADGVIRVGGDRVYHPEYPLWGTVDDDGTARFERADEEPGGITFGYYAVSECYSTEPAARDAGKGVGDGK